MVMKNSNLIPSYKVLKTLAITEYVYCCLFATLNTERLTKHYGLGSVIVSTDCYLVSRLLCIFVAVL